MEETMPPLKNMETLRRAAEKLNNPSLSLKIGWLQSHKSDDPLQQMQTDAIVDLYAAVRQIQENIWPLLALIPDVSAVKDAAGQPGPTTGSPAFHRLR
jgi:hypothetical protein